ncbi:MAG: SulP family inorganic anion transporter [Deltaproteobacteria bacterium]|jgi:SulP family sulfate permease
MPENSATGSALRRDLVAALTVAFVGLPQCLAYALMSGLPPAYGLATAAVPGFVAALVGKSPYIVTGPTNTTGLLILAALGPFLGDDGLLRPDGLAALATLTLMAGAIRVLAALANGAALVDFIPESVLTGFTAGAGLLIAIMQLDEALGLAGVRGSSAYAQLASVFDHVSATAWPAVVTTLGTVVLVAVARRIRPAFPGALVSVGLATAVAMLFGLDAAEGLPVVADRAAVPSGWPLGAWPSFDPELIQRFIGPAGAIALLGTMELAVSARRGGARPNMRREIIAQGAANLAGAFTSAFPASASLTRSALLELGGARTRLAAAGAAVIVVPILFLGAEVVAALPMASLAGVLFVTAAKMVDRRRLQRVWSASRVSRNLMLVTFVATLTLPLEWAVFTGVALGLAQYLAESRKPGVRLFEPIEGRLLPVTRAEAGPVVVVEISGDCHFAAAGALEQLLLDSLPECPEHVIVDLTHAHALRVAALLSLERVHDRIRACGGRLHLAGVPEDFFRLLARTGSKLRADPFDAEPLASVRRVVASVAPNA